MSYQIKTEQCRGKEEIYTFIFKCLNCDTVRIRTFDNYCSECGIELNWDEWDYTLEEEKEKKRYELNMEKLKIAINEAELGIINE